MKPLAVLFLAGALIWAFLKLYPTGNETPDGGAVVASAGAGVEAPGGQAPAQPAAAGGTQEPAPAGGSGLFEQARADENLFIVEPTDAAEGPEAEILGQLLAQERLEEARAHAERFAGLLPTGTAQAVEAFVTGLGGDVEAARGPAERAVEEGLAQGPGLDLLRAALRAGPFPLEGKVSSGGPIELGMELALHLQAARLAAQREQYADAEFHYSKALLGELEAPWKTDGAVLQRWSDELMQLQERHRWSRQGDWPHVVLEVENGDSLITIRKRFLEKFPDQPMCTGLIARANGADEVIHEGDKLRVPTEPIEVVVDVSSRWLAYTIGGNVVFTTQVGVGREGEETLLGVFEAGNKNKEPMYFPRGKQPVPFGSPDNPLGTRWIGWRFPGQEKDTSFGFHGTREPESIGKAQSEGCVRMHNADVEQLYELVPTGARLVVRD